MKPIWTHWVNGVPLTQAETRIAMNLREHGCKCEMPLFSKDRRCRLCNTRGDENLRIK